MLLGRHGVQLTEAAVQLHGGIGMTQEYGVGNYLRRMTVIDLLFGDAKYHASRHGAAMLAG
jgi:pimeloyl-CoA dehydrogenase